MILVTGATGLVGSHLILALVMKGHNVRALKRKSGDLGQVRKVFGYYSRQADELFEKVEWVEGDILDYFSLEDALQGVEIIYHCAAIISFDPRRRDKVIQNNVEGTANLVNAALIKGVKRICHLSSVSALGSKTDGMTVNEDSPWNPSVKNSVYSVSKFYSEAEIWRGVEEGLEAVVVHPSVIIGPGNWKKGSGRFFDMIYNGLLFYTSGITGYVDVRDVVDALLMLTDEAYYDRAKNQKFLLSSEDLEFKKFMKMIADSLHKPGPRFKAGYLILHLVKTMGILISLVTGKEANLSNETISSAIRRTYFNGSRICEMFGFKYRLISEAVGHTSACYLREKGFHQA